MTYAYGLPTGMKMTGLKSFTGSTHMEAATPGLGTVPIDDGRGGTKRSTVPADEPTSALALNSPGRLPHSRTVSEADEPTDKHKTIASSPAHSAEPRNGEQDPSYDKHTTVHEETDDTEEESAELEPSEAGSEATTVIKEVPKPHLELHDTTNTVCPVKPKLDGIRQLVLPESFGNRNRFERCRLEDSFDEKAWDAEYASRHGSADQPLRRRIHIRPLDTDTNLGTSVSHSQRTSNINLLSQHFHMQRQNTGTCSDDPLQG